MSRTTNLITSSMLAVATCFAGAPAWAADQPGAEGDKERIERLEATVADLTRRLSSQEQKDAAREQEPTWSSRRQRSAGGHHLEVYGFAQVDAVQDFKRVDPDWDATLRPSKIPTVEGQFGSDGQTVFSVRQSRLGVKGNGTLAGKPYEAKFEFDLYGTGVDAGQTTMRIRHAYAKWGPVLAGQTNTLFMDGDLLPNTLDYWGPIGLAFVRTPQVRLTFVDNDRWMFAMAVENPSDDIDTGAIRLIDPELATNLRANEELPDLTAQVQYRAPWGHLVLAGIARKVGFDTVGLPSNEPSGSEFGWGINAGAVVKASLATFRAAVVYGKGIATYMNDGGTDLAPSANLTPVVAPPIFPAPPGPTINQLLEAKTVPLLGVSTYVELQWSKQWSSTVGYSFLKVDNTNFQDATAFHKGEYASGNLLWTPADRLTTGLELLWGRRTDNDGNKGTDLRTQFSFKIAFSSNDIWGD